MNTCESHLGNESRGEERDEATGPQNIHIRNGDRSEDKTGNLWAAASNQGLAGGDEGECPGKDCSRRAAGDM